MRKKANTTPAPDQGAVQPAVAENRDAQHHPCGPSKWPALLECPCFQSKPPTEDTKRGTELHALFEAVLKGTYADEPVDAMEKHVVNAARKLQEGANTGHFHVEELVELPPPSDSPSTKCEFYGRLDLGWRNWDTGDLHVADLKLSENPDRDHRAQLLGYAAGIMRRLKYTPTLVYLHVAYADTGNITQEVMAGDEAWAEYNANYRRIEAIWKGKANPSPRQCGWCALCAKFTTCPAMNAVVEKASPRLADAAKPERWVDLSSKQKAQACALADTLAKWCEAVKDNAAADARAGETIEDPENCIYYGLQDRRGRFVIPDVQVAWQILNQHLTAESYRSCLSVNQAALRMALKQAGVKLSEINTLIERCGSRLPDTTAFVRRGLKESA